MKALREVLHRYWGYSKFRPLQLEAMQSVMESRDSVVVLPTGGGKSLCFQVPALALDGLGIVVSPLISLMKDQVDTLVDCGVPAAYLNSTSSTAERRRAAVEIRAGRLKLLYLSPERLMTEQTLAFLREIKLSFVAIDEAHCISDWGHDFRPEYRMLGTLKQHFLGLPIHAYTATATERVRDDIVRLLQLAEPHMLVGSFDRPNLEYRVIRRTNLMSQIHAVVDRHSDQSGIIYCMRRKDVESICEDLRSAGRQALPYHAGLSDEERRRHQDDFINDRARIIVATVAFGMGIDKPDVRYVIHAAAPKSLEHYQQESGRAGRDGLEAECYLFYSPGDFIVWRQIQEKSPGANPESIRELLAGIERFCTTMQCRHRMVIGYFGQELESENCGACDICLKEVSLLADSLVVAQKILSCVVRVGENFGAAYVGKVLVGSREKRIVEQGHHQLSTYGLLSQHGLSDVRAWIEQLIEQGFLVVEGEYRVLRVTPQGWRTLRGDIAPRLSEPMESTERTQQPSRTSLLRSKSAAPVDAWDGVDRALFEILRQWRRAKAEAKGIPPFIVLGDVALRDLARRRPSTSEGLLGITGIGEKKLAEYGDDLLRQIDVYCQRSESSRDVGLSGKKGQIPDFHEESESTSSTSNSRDQAFQRFALGESLEQVAAAVGRAKSTTVEYLTSFIEQEQLFDPQPWLDDATVERVGKASTNVEGERLRPIFEALGETISFDDIRIARAFLRNRQRALGQSSSVLNVDAVEKGS